MARIVQRIAADTPSVISGLIVPRAGDVADSVFIETFLIITCVAAAVGGVCGAIGLTELPGLLLITVAGSVAGAAALATTSTAPQKRAHPETYPLPPPPRSRLLFPLLVGDVLHLCLGRRWRRRDGDVGHRGERCRCPLGIRAIRAWPAATMLPRPGHDLTRVPLAQGLFALLAVIDHFVLGWFACKRSVCCGKQK